MKTGVAPCGSRDAARVPKVSQGAPVTKMPSIGRDSAGIGASHFFRNGVFSGTAFGAEGVALDLVSDRPAAQSQHDLKELQVVRTALVKDRTRLKNRLKTRTLALTRRQTRARLAHLALGIERAGIAIPLCVMAPQHGRNEPDASVQGVAAPMK